MNAGTISIKNVFGQERRLEVPLFQRPYVWKRETQWGPLWEDIRAVAERLSAKQPTRPHFLGAIVLDQQPHPVGHVETRLVIDGQQRLATIQIFLEAFCDVCKSIGNTDYHQALLQLTRNNNPLSKDPDEQFKVWPTNVDQEHFRKVMQVGSPAELRKAYKLKPKATEVGHPLADGYLFFFDQMHSWLTASDNQSVKRIDALYNAIRDYIRLVVIDLDKDDDAQLIFETLNARGTPLLPADLIKNFLFHRAQLAGEQLEPLYESYWKPFDANPDYWRQELGRGHAKRARIDIFLQHYLTLHTGDEIAVGHVYVAFRELAAKAASVRDVLASVREYSEVYQSFDAMPADTPEGLFFDRLANMDQTTAFPLLMELFVRHRNDGEQVRSILNDLESFLVRRMVCQLSTRGYNRLFIDLLAAFKGADGTLATRVRQFLLSSDAESNRWPDDNQFRKSWLETPLFRVLLKRRTRMILEAIELALRTGKTEKIQLNEKLTIEHLMPRKWGKHWPLPGIADQAEERMRRDAELHTIGNLTLLTKKLNPSLRNGPWQEKRSAIPKHSILRLNQSFVDKADWNEDAIHKRGDELFEIARKIWPHPALDGVKA